MHMIETRQLKEHIAPHHLDAATGIRCSVAKQPTPHAFGDARLRMAQPSVATMDAIADHEFGDEARLEKLRDIRGIVLTIAIEGSDPIAARVTDT